MANTYLTRTTSTPTNDKIMTISFWLKKGVEQEPLFSRHVDSSNRFQFYNLDGSNGFQLYQTVGGSVEMNLTHTKKLRDFTGWYHWVIAIDTTQATDTNRVKIYINGDLQSGYATATYPAQNADMLFNNSSVVQEIGRVNGNDYFNGSLSHFQFVDGAQLTPSYFGQTDSTTGEWKFGGNAGSITYGNNGFHILKDGNSVTDQSGNSNNFTVAGGTLTKTEDNPSNIFATLNPLVKKVSSMTFSNGNNTITTSGSQWEGSVTTLAPHKGKWYWEAKYNTGSGIKLDIARMPEDLRNMATANQSYLAYHGDGYGYQLNNSGTDYYCANNSCTTWNSSVNGNSTKIYMVAVDLDNGKMWIGANGSWANKSGTANPVTGDDPLHDFSAKINGEPWLFSMSVEGNSGSHNANFGNGYFGTTAVSSAGTNASGNGIFEYDVPTGYTALCTKGLNSF